MCPGSAFFKAKVDLASHPIPSHLIHRFALIDFSPVHLMHPLLLSIEVDAIIAFYQAWLSEVVLDGMLKWLYEDELWG